MNLEIPNGDRSRLTGYPIINNEPRSPLSYMDHRNRVNRFRARIRTQQQSKTEAMRKSIIA